MCSTQKKLTTLRLLSSYYDPTYIVCTCDVIAGPIREDFVKDVVYSSFHGITHFQKKNKKENYVQEYKLRKDFIPNFFLNFNHHMVNRYILKNVYPYRYIAEILPKWRKTRK